MNMFFTIPAHAVVAGCLTLFVATSPLSADVIDQPFNDGFETYLTGDIRPSGLPIGDPDAGNPDTPWAGAASHFGNIVNIDDEGIRATTPPAQFGNQVLKFDNPYSSTAPQAQTIDQASREFHDNVVGLDFAVPIHVSFDIRSIEGIGGTASAEVNIGRARAGRMSFTTDTGGNGLRIIFYGGEGFQNPGGALTLEFVSDELTMGQWYNVSYGLDVANDRYTFIEIDGQFFDNDGMGWNAGVNRFGDDIQHIHLIQGANSADLGGVYLDNIAVTAIPGPGGLALLGLSGLLVWRRRR